MNVKTTDKNNSTINNSDSANFQEHIQEQV